MKKAGIPALVLIIAVCLVGCKSENPWIPKVQGSHVSEMPFEQIDGEFVAEKYTDFKSFKKSELADYNFISKKTAREERYSAEFFKTRDLGIIKFNKPEKGIEYTVTDVNFSGNDCVVTLLPVKNPLAVEAQDTTYYCFLETENDLKNSDLKLEFLPEIIHESDNHAYISPENNLPYLFKNETAPVMFKINSAEGVREFIEQDEVLDEYNFVAKRLSMYSDGDFENSSLLLVRVPSSDLEKCIGLANNNSVEIVGVKSNHYLYGWEKNQEFSALITLFVPKEFSPDSISRTNYTEYDDNADNKAVFEEFKLDGKTEISENLIRYDFK